MIYNIDTEMLINILQLFLGNLIGMEQAACITGRNLQDNTPLTCELMHGYSESNIFPRAGIRIDIHKAYDSIQRVS